MIPNNLIMKVFRWPINIKFLVEVALQGIFLFVAAGLHGPILIMSCISATHGVFGYGNDMNGLIELKGCIM